MKQCRVSAFARVARFIALAAVALGLGAGSLLAQGSTGKIEGRVRDQAGAPIANAQVFIVGTAFNALTNPQGYYFMNNVPAGTIAVRAAFIGYKSTQVEGVRVLAGQTITVDIQLEQTAVEIQEITVVTQTAAAGARATRSPPSSGSTARSSRSCRSTGSTASWRCSRAWSPARTSDALSIRGGRDRPERHLHRRRAGAGGLSRHQPGRHSSGRPRGRDPGRRRHRRLRAGLGHHRRHPRRSSATPRPA